MEKRERFLKIHHRPELKEPFLVAAGQGTADVGLRTVSLLRDKLGAELFAEIEPGDFFSPPHGFAFHDGLIELAFPHASMPFAGISFFPQSLILQAFSAVRAL